MAKQESPGDDWRTPEWVWGPYYDRYDFKLDAAATAENSVVPRNRLELAADSKFFISKEEDALELDWREKAKPGSAIWVNPPYSQKAGPLYRWVRKFFAESRFFLIVALLPADTSTSWFDEIYSRNSHQWRPGCVGRFLPKRVQHIDPKTGLPKGSPKFSSIIVRFDQKAYTDPPFVGAAFDQGETR
jgi:phage N-6-adenine-methyltransferase